MRKESTKIQEKHSAKHGAQTPHASRIEPRSQARRMAPYQQHSPILISVPLGLSVSGITAWTLRLSAALAAEGRRVGLLLHAEPPGMKRLEAAIAPNVHTFDLTDLGRLEACEGNLAPFVARYRAAATQLGASTRHPAVLFCGVHGDCYGIGAAMCLAEPAAVRLIGVMHSDIEYDARVIAHYQTALAKAIGVSELIAESLKQRLPTRADDICHVPYGVEVPTLTQGGIGDGAASPMRATAPSTSSSPLRLLYTGRIEHRQKRIGALVEMSRELNRRNIAHHLTMIGEGPAREELLGRSEIRNSKSAITLLPPQPPHTIAAHLAQADIFVLSSRYEGLSVSLLEAMAAGCVPVIARTRSGSTEALADGITGILADIAEDASDADAGIAMANAVQRAQAIGIDQLSRATHARARERYSMQTHTPATLAVIDAAAKSKPRAWPADRPCAFTARSNTYGSGSVPPEGPHAMASTLAKLAGKKIVIHGAGRHTLELAHVIAEAPAQVVAITDDDESKHGKQLFGWEIIPAKRAHATGATDVVISSWMHADSLWSRRAEYELQGLRVHRLYPAA